MRLHATAPGREMPRRRRAAAARARVVLVCLALVCFALVLPAAASAQDAPSFADAVTTTGPTPPPGVHPAVGLHSTLATAGEVLLDVPAYIWHDGCAPTSLGMVLGYYDGHGFPDLIAGDASDQTTNAAVNQAIASHGSAVDPGHWEDYALPKETGGSVLADKSEAPAGDEHASDSLADFMRTSWSADGLPYGWSSISMVGPALEAYVPLVDPSVTVASVDYWYGNTYGGPELTFARLQAEIDAGRPMVFYVDCTGDGVTDHAIAAIGYRETSGSPEFAYWDTWDRTVQWSRFRGLSSTYKWGVLGGTAFTLSSGGQTADLSRPHTTVSGVPEGWSRKPVTLTFRADDVGTGVDRVEAGVDGADLASLGGSPATLEVSGQGVHAVRYRAWDKSGNGEAVHTCDVRIDGVGPTTTARPARARRGARVTLRYQVDDLTPRADVRLTIRTLSGRLRATLRPGLQATGSEQSTSWRVTLRSGVYRVRVYAVDQAGNAQVTAGSARLVVR